MQAIIEFAPWVIFGLVYKFGGGLYPATASLMVAMALLLAYDWLRERKLPQMHLVLAGLVWVFGTATLILRDVRFLQWKASVFYWICAIALVGSVFIGKQTLLQRLLGKTLPEDFKVSERNWRNGSLLIGAIYLALGCANIWVALHRSEADWVFFKVWVLPPVGIVLTMGAALWMLREGFTSEKAS